ncbi:MAG TPA: hypothetical protein ENH62_02430 [Marinobacter sp.]|nr:hypothetical protein [Marinobacter sp.]
MSELDPKALEAAAIYEACPGDSPLPGRQSIEIAIEHLREPIQKYLDAADLVPRKEGVSERLVLLDAMKVIQDERDEAQEQGTSLTDEALGKVIYATLRRCSHSLDDSVVAERIATAVIIAETRAALTDTEEAEDAQ